MTADHRKSWAPEERAEFDALMAEVVSATPDTSERLSRLERGIADAIQAQRWWATDVRSSALRAGLAKEIKAYQDRVRKHAFIDPESGQVLNMPAIQGTKRRGASGEIFHQRELIEKWAWEQIIEKRAETIRACRHYDAKIAHYDRLLALRELCPDSATPIEAAARLGINLDDFLVRAAEAA